MRVARGPVGPLVTVLAAALAVAGAVTAVLATGSRARLDDLLIVLAVAAYATVAVVVLLARPGHRVGRVMLVGAVAWGVGEGLLGLALAAVAERPESAAAALAGVLGTAARGFGWLMLVLALPLVFPDGRPASRRAARLVALTVVAFTLGTLIAPVPLEVRLESARNPIGLPEPWGFVADLLALGALVLAFAALVTVIVGLVRRWRSGGELLRQQVLVFGVAFAAPLLLLPLVATPLAQPWMFAAATLPVPVAVAVAMFQRRLYDARLVLDRTLTYAVLSAALATIYAVVVGGVGVVLRDRGTPWLPWAAAGVVAVVFAPLRDSVQRTVNRLIHGGWAAPQEVLAHTGRRLADAADGRSLLAALTSQLVHGLGFGYASIRDGTGRLLAEEGVAAGPLETLPLTAYGREVGTLGFAGRALRPSDRELLTDLAHQIGGAVHSAGLVEALRDAQTQLVAAREQERRRLRRDLHDGLGPSLAGLGFQIDTVQNLLAAGESVDERLVRLRAGLVETIAEVRRVVEALRPPTLDDLGLFGAVAALGHELAVGAGVTVTTELPEERPELPAAVEVAAFRVVQEALTNVVRHAGATTCRVTGHVNGEGLVLEVSDDGRGGAVPGRGLGLPGMGERAREIGGCVEVVELEPGTSVRVRLPLQNGAHA